MRHIELRAEYDLHNGNFIGDTFKELDDCYPQKYAIIVSDLLSVKRAIQNDKEEVKLYASVESKEDYYDETITVLEKTGLDFYSDEPGRLKFSPIEE